MLHAQLLKPFAQNEMNVIVLLRRARKYANQSRAVFAKGLAERLRVAKKNGSRLSDFAETIAQCVQVSSVPLRQLKPAEQVLMRVFPCIHPLAV